MESSGKWSRVETLELIKAYKKRPLLYKISHPSHVNHKKRKEAYLEVLNDLKKKDIVKGLENIKSKWRVLNRQALVEHRKMVAHIESGQSIETFKSTLWCFEQLYFVLKVNQAVVGSNAAKMYDEEIEESEKEDENNDDNNDEVELSSVSVSKPLTKPLPPKKQQKVSFETIQSCAQESLELMSLLLKKAENNKIESFCSMLSSELKEFNYPETYDAVTMEILQIIRKTKAKRRSELYEEISKENSSNLSDISFDVSDVEDLDPISIENSSSNQKSNYKRRRLLSIGTDSDLVDSEYENYKPEQYEEYLLE